MSDPTSVVRRGISDANTMTRLGILYKLALATSEDLSSELVLEATHRELSRVFDVSGFLVGTPDQDGDNWTAIFKVEQGERKEIVTNPLSHGLMGYVLRSRKGLLLNSVAEKQEFIARERISPGHPSAKCWMGVPLVAKDSLVGAMAVQNYKAEHCYGQDDFELFQAIASIVAASLQNAHLFEALRQKSQQATETARALAISARYSRGLLEASLDAMVTISSGGKISDANAATERITGVDRQTLVGTDFAEYFTEPELARLGYETAFQEGQVVDYPLSIRHRGGAVSEVLYNAAVFRDDEGAIQGVFAAARDVTQIHRAERETAELQQRLLQSQKLESLGVLASGIAHEVNNVLSTILTISSTRLLTLSPDNPNYRAFQNIFKSAERGGKTVQSLLGFSRKTIGAVSELVMNDLIADYTGLLRQSMPAHIKLQIELDPNLRFVHGDPAALTEVLASLCSNAIDAMPEKGVLRFRTFNSAGFVIVEIQDTGVGMSPEVQRRAPDPFFTTKSQGKGAGLGLSLVYKTLDAHHADVKIDSSEGKGTTVTIRFQGFDAPKKVSEVEDLDVTSSGLNVLVVDDDAQVRESLAELIETMGHLVSTASGGREAIAKLEDGPVPDLVILDLNMPDWSGADVLAHLRPLCPDLPVILSTGRTDQLALDLVESVSHVTLLSKPYGVEELRRELVKIKASRDRRT